jgi:hypothetical protein
VQLALIWIKRVVHRRAHTVAPDQRRQGIGSKKEFNANERKGAQMNADASVLNTLSKRVMGCALTVSSAPG